MQTAPMSVPPITKAYNTSIDVTLNPKLLLILYQVRLVAVLLVDVWHDDDEPALERGALLVANVPRLYLSAINAVVGRRRVRAGDLQVAGDASGD